jgi:hypothetical protein
MTFFPMLWAFYFVQNTNRFIIVLIFSSAEGMYGIGIDARASLKSAMPGFVCGQMSYIFDCEKPWCMKNLNRITFHAITRSRRNAENAVWGNWTGNMGENSVDRRVVKRLNANGMFPKC